MVGQSCIVPFNLQNGALPDRLATFRALHAAAAQVPVAALLRQIDALGDLSCALVRVQMIQTPLRL